MSTKVNHQGQVIHGSEQIADFGVEMHNALVSIGERFGIYQVMSELGRVTPAELAERTGIAECAAGAWLHAQSLGDFLGYDANTGRYALWCSWPRE